MTQADFDRFEVLMQGVAECYGQTLSAQGVALRFKLLEQFSLPEVEKAALSIMASRKYTSMPVPADFLEHISGGAAEDKAEVEAGKVLTAIGRHGGYALSFLITMSASWRLGLGQVLRKPVRSFFHLFFLGNLG